MGELSALLRSFCCALRGILRAVATQRNLRIHFTAAAAVVIFGRMAQLSITHWCIEILCCMLVISMELLNSALEAACDRICPEQHHLIRYAKDAAAGAVLISAIGSVVIALLLFFAGDSSYYLCVASFIRQTRWVKYALVFGAAAGLVFIFLPSALQKRKEAEGAL